jgi:pimeloyl-ACP methyl ester carboxylesterase
MRAEPLELTAPDGVILRGQYWPGGDTWIVLLHEAGKDLDGWQPLVLPLLEKGYSLLTLDLRGHGASDGEWDVSRLGGDLEAAIGVAHERGAQQVGFVGAGESVLPAFLDAHARQLFAIIALSPGPLGDLPVDELRKSAVAKLFVVGSLDQQAVDAEQQIRDRVIGWTVRLRLPTAERGTSLLAGQWRLHVQENIVAFLEEQRQLGNESTGAAANAAAGAALAEMLFNPLLVREEPPDDAAPSADQSQD